MDYRQFLDTERVDTSSYVMVDDTHLRIADCNKSVDLYFAWGRYESSRTKAAALAKLQVLRTALDLLEENIRKSK